MTQSKIDNTDTITITAYGSGDSGVSTITLDTSTSSNVVYNNPFDTSYTTISSIGAAGSIGTIDISSLTSGSSGINTVWGTSFANTMWEDCMPDMQTVTKMCEEYPALSKAYENFKTVYTLVEQDYKGKQEEK